MMKTLGGAKDCGCGTLSSNEALWPHGGPVQCGHW